jgi:hypothetical protein
LNTDNAAKITNNLGISRSIVPFTGGLFVIYAFFWPEEYGHWLGSVVHSFRVTAGF